MTPQNENFARDVQALVLSMPVAQMLKLRFERMEPGEVDLCLPYQESLSFRPGQLQATPVFAIADFAAVSAAGTLLPTGWRNATVDCSIKYLAPADGETLLARGRGGCVFSQGGPGAAVRHHAGHGAEPGACTVGGAFGAVAPERRMLGAIEIDFSL